MLVAAQDAGEVHAKRQQQRRVGGRLQPRGHLWGRGISGRPSLAPPTQPTTPPRLCHAHHAHPYLLVVGPDQAEDEAAVHQGQQIAEEEGQAGVQALGQLCVLGAQGRSAHAHLSHGASVSTLGLAPPRVTHDLQEPHHCPKALGLLDTPSFLASRCTWPSRLSSSLCPAPFPRLYVYTSQDSVQNTVFFPFIRWEQHNMDGRNWLLTSPKSSPTQH